LLEMLKRFGWKGYVLMRRGIGVESSTEVKGRGVVEKKRNPGGSEVGHLERTPRGFGLGQKWTRKNSWEEGNQ